MAGPLEYVRVKRALDVAVCSAALVVLSPLLLATAIAIKLDSPGPVLFRQQRLGLNAQEFTIYKLRTMSVGAEAGGVYEAKRDARVTTLGRVLRRTSIDELPQLVNIIKGEMSIIGPRPTLTYHPWPLEDYTSEQRRRFDVRPGVTGWAQVNGRKTVDWHQRIKFDVEYVDHLSAAFDLRIFVRTVRKVLAMSDNVNTTRTAAPLPQTDSNA
ncbi:sugar transferase [Aestuariimicrobium sp. Y1814]|uniref:sugar transferase n=1 Tax=Aestuariimicrobium sp. Y1814 TaxID=3418742 RepID=UPI003DA79617